MGQFNVDHLQATNITSTGVLQALGGFKFPSVTAATRPSSPVAGQTVYNTTGVLKFMMDLHGILLKVVGNILHKWCLHRPTSGLVNGLVGVNTADSKLEIYDVATTSWIQIIRSI